LRDADGTEVGSYNAAVVGPWHEGEQLYEGGWPKWRITAVGDAAEAGGESWAGVFEVEAVSRKDRIRCRTPGFIVRNVLPHARWRIEQGTLISSRLAELTPADGDDQKRSADGKG
jgi:hypothetical protein